VSDDLAAEKPCCACTCVLDSRLARAGELLTDDVDGGEPVGEAPRRASGEVDAVGRVVGARQRHDVVVVAVVHERVAEDEVARHLRVAPRHRHRPAHRRRQPQQPPRLHGRALPAASTREREERRDRAIPGPIGGRRRLLSLSLSLSEHHASHAAVYIGSFKRGSVCSSARGGRALAYERNRARAAAAASSWKQKAWHGSRALNPGNNGNVAVSFGGYRERADALVRGTWLLTELNFATVLQR
jgi:hypothetical protein